MILNLNITWWEYNPNIIMFYNFVKSKIERKE